MQMLARRWRTAMVATLAVLAVLAVSAGPAMAQDRLDNAGTNFWVAFPTNYVLTPRLTLFITGDTATDGTVEIPGLGFTQDFSVTPGTVTSVELPNNAQVSEATTTGEEPKGIHVTAEDEVVVYGLSRIEFSTDAYLGLPTDVIGMHYTVMAWGIGCCDRSEFAVAPSQDDTDVTITPSVVTSGGHPAGMPFTVNLDRGDVFQVQAGVQDDDLTGSIVDADKPVSVFGGHECANIPDQLANACDHVVEQLPPDDTWGEAFLTVPLATRVGGDTFRFLASRDNTTVMVNGATVATLDAGEQHTQIIDGVSRIAADNPILVAQFSNSTSFDGVTSDPFMMLIPPFEQFQTGYTVTTPESGFAQNFVNLVVPDAAVGDVEVDGTPVPASEYTPIPGSGFRGAQVPISLGSHTITGPGDPFGAFVYGFDSFDSYGYPGGLNLAPVALTESVTLTPSSETVPTGTEQCVTAEVLDSDDDPVPGVRVDFVVTGANPTSGSQNADANGQAEFCWTGTNEGLDTVEGSVGALSDTATKNWVGTPPPTEGPAGDPTCSDGVDNDRDGQTDAADPDCQVAPTPEGPPGHPSCSDGVDNDQDGQTDAADADCQTAPPGGDTCQGRAPTMTGSGAIAGTPGNDVIVGSNGPDTITGGGGHDLICARGGDDTVDAGKGDDRVNGDGGEDSIKGGSGNDMLNAGTGADRIRGQAGNDLLGGGDGGDELLGGEGNDGVYGQDGEDDLHGGRGHDTLSGGADDDELRGAGGADRQFGDAGDDRLFGDGDDDRLVGGDGQDRMFGRSGERDRLIADDGERDLVDCGDGADDRAVVDELDVVRNCEDVQVD